MDEAEFKRRTARVGLETLSLCDSVRRSPGSDAIVRQLVRSATAVGANYRAACRAHSTKDVLYKLGIVEEEADESLYWFELLIAGRYAPAERVEPLRREMNELLAMTVASRRTLRSRLARPDRARPASESKIDESTNRKSNVAS
jgi:four helix bundle protein